MEARLKEKVELEFVRVTAARGEDPMLALESAAKQYLRRDIEAAKHRLWVIAVLAFVGPLLIFDHFGVNGGNVIWTFFLLVALGGCAWTSCDESISGAQLGIEAQKRRDNRRLSVLATTPLVLFYFLVLVGRGCGNCRLTPGAAFLFVSKGIAWIVFGMLAITAFGIVIAATGSMIRSRLRRPVGS